MKEHEIQQGQTNIYNKPSDPHSRLTRVPQVAEAHARDAVPAATAVAGTGLGYVHSIQPEGRHVLLGAALLDPPEPGLAAGKHNMPVSQTSLPTKTPEHRKLQKQLQRFNIYLGVPDCLVTHLTFVRCLFQIFLKSRFLPQYGCFSTRRLTGTELFFFNRRLLMARSIL